MKKRLIIEVVPGALVGQPGTATLLVEGQFGAMEIVALLHDAGANIIRQLRQQEEQLMQAQLAAATDPTRIPRQ